jgi:hypothetical protein
LRYSLLAVIVCTKLLQADPFSYYYEILDLDQATVLCDSRQAGSCDTFSRQITIDPVSPSLYMEPNGIYTASTRSFFVDNRTDYYLHLVTHYSNTIDLGFWEWAGGTPGAAFMGGVAGVIDWDGVNYYEIDWPWPAGNPLFEGEFVHGVFGEPFQLKASITGGEDRVFAPGGGRSGFLGSLNLFAGHTGYAWLMSGDCGAYPGNVPGSGCGPEDIVNAYIIPSLPSGDPASQVPEPSTYLLVSAGLAAIHLRKRA